jgi:hypothetical protein
MQISHKTLLLNSLCLKCQNNFDSHNKAIMVDI